MKIKSNKFLGQAINSLRIKKRMTQQELADFLNINRTRLSGIENGRYNVSINEACIILGMLGYELELNI
jgi:transcriptional regulator with XRE-family HTH domain